MNTKTRKTGFFITLGLLLMVHHFLFWGRIIDVEDVLHHEFFEAIFITAGLTLIVCVHMQK